LALPDRKQPSDEPANDCRDEQSDNEREKRERWKAAAGFSHGAEISETSVVFRQSGFDSRRRDT
jgi:hypothetical protein